LAYYCNLNDFKSVLQQSLTTGAPSLESGTEVDLINIGNGLSFNNFSETLVWDYIRYASAEIDSGLSQMYRVPFHKITLQETTLDVDAGTEYSTPNQIVTTDELSAAPGDEIILSTSVPQPTKVRLHVTEIGDDNVLTVEENITVPFYSESTRVLKVGYNPALALMAARIAAGNFFDKYFSSNQSPGESDYGKRLRMLSFGQLTDILQGTTILHGQERIGHRFYNTNLVSRYGLPPHDNKNDNRELKRDGG